jgi:hypothetical protein
MSKSTTINSKYLTALTFIFFFQVFCYGQKLEILIKDQKGSPILGATIKITNVENKLVLNAISNVEGKAFFTLKSYGKYNTKITYIGFKDYIKDIDIYSDNKSFTFILDEDSKSLQSIVVTAKKPLLTQEEDKTIVDPESLANVSTNSYEILEKTPGLFLDQDGNIYLNTTTPAKVFINGREQKLGPSDIAAILKSLPPGAIEKIELIASPSASMDASSSGGVVNIILKKGVKLGRTGTISAGFNQGRLGNQFVGVNLNRSQDKRSSYLQFNFNQRNSFDDTQFLRQLESDGSPKNLRSESYSLFPAYGFFTGLGANIDISSKLETGYDGRLNINKSDSKIDNNSWINLINQNAPISQNSNSLINDNFTYNVNQGLNAKYKFDSTGSFLKADLSIDHFETKGSQNYNTIFSLPSQIILKGNGDLLNNRTLFTSMIDFKYYFPHKIIFEAGLKNTFMNFNSDTDYSLTKDNITQKDNFRTNQFLYKENINAYYLQGSKSFGKFLLKMGGRLENTRMNGNQIIPSDTTFKINRTDFFPYIYFSRKLFTVAKYELRGYLIARRTISRPVYEQLNPFARFVDPYNYEAGNPALKPQFSNNYEANISFENRPIFALGRNYVNDIFSSVVYQDKTNPLLSYRTFDNLGKNKETYFRATAALPPGGKYFFVLGTQYNHNEYTGILDSKTFSFSRGSWSLFTYHQLKIDKVSNISMYGFARFNGQMQFYELSNFGSLNFYLDRQFLSRKLAVSVNATDIFLTNRYDFNLSQGNITGNGRRLADTRRFGINVRYTFGQKKKTENMDFLDMGNDEPK